MRFTDSKKPFFALFASLFFAVQAAAQWSSTDFLIADFVGNRIAVYDRNLVFQRYLDTDFRYVSGLDFTADGRLVATGRVPSRLKIYNSSGTILTDVEDERTGNSIDAKTAASGNIFIGGQREETSVSVFNPNGTFNRRIGTMSYAGIAVFGNTLWAGGGNLPGVIEVFDVTTNVKTATIPLDNLQVVAQAMHYSRSTDTILTTDFFRYRIYERTTDGAFVRYFDDPGGLGGAEYGVTRGPEGDVYATCFFTSQVCRWRAGGAFVGCTNIRENVINGTNIVWAGNVAAASNPVSVSGRVLRNGHGLANASVAFTDHTGAVRTAKTNSLGYYGFKQIDTGHTYTFRVSAKGLSFAPHVVNLDEARENLDFEAQ